MAEVIPLAQDRSRAEQRSRGRSQALAWIGLVLAVAALAGILAALFRRWRPVQRPRPRPQARPPQPQAVLDLQGLTEEEAAARQLEGQGGAAGVIHFKPPRSRREILRANTLTIFNLSLVGLAVVQVLLGKPWDAVLTTGVLALGIGLNIGQELWARGRVQELGRAARSQPTVVREGVARSIDPREVVRGDLLVVGPGDQILADGHVVGEGQMVVDESMLTGDPRQHLRRAGEPVYAGSFCLAGYGAYEARKVGDDRLIVALSGEGGPLKEELTPLERTMARLLRALLILVTALSLLLLADYFDLSFPGLHVDAFASAASVIFGLAPSSLFLMILVNYAMGTADLARIGALVHRTRSVESLAQATVLCFTQAGILTGVGVEVEPVDIPRGAGGTHRPQLAGSRIRQILGDYARSTSTDNPAVQAMLAAFPGNQRRLHEESPFLSLYGWSAVTFDYADLRGVYVLGEPQVLESHLISDGAEPAEGVEATSLLAGWRAHIASLGRTLGQAVGGSRMDPGSAQTERMLVAESGGAQGSEPAVLPNRIAPVSVLLRQVADQASRLLRREPSGPVEVETGVQGAQEVVYLVAYHPEVVSLHTADGRPRLPEELVPLCRLRYSLQVRPEAIETIRAFSQAGVQVKVFSPDEPERIATILEQAGLGDGGAGQRAISGLELAALDGGEWAQAAAQNTIFGQVTPEQAGQVVDALREQGEVVAVVGDGVSDLPAMRQAHLSITRQSSGPATLSVADIVLLEDSPHVLVRVLDKGQRIANGLLDILKLYLNQLFYLTLLILVIWGTGLGFPYQSKQGSLITIVSVVLPSLGLSLWAPAGVLSRTRLGWLLARFVTPAAVSISAAGVLVYLFFLDRSGDVAYAQLALTYLLVISGLVVVVLLRPPFRRLSGRWLAGVGQRTGMGGDERSGDPRPAALALVLLVLVFIAAWVPLAEQLFGLKHLQQPVDYLVVGLAVGAWVAAATLLWRIAPLERLATIRAPSAAKR